MTRKSNRNDDQASLTHVSLLSRLRKDDRDGEAWVQFVDRYGSRIYQWCVTRKLKPDDAEDVTQNVLLKIAKVIGTFQYDPNSSFRGWLRRVTENAVVDFLRQCRSRESMLSASTSIELLSSQSARDDLLTRLESIFDMELFEFAMDRVRTRVNPSRWLAWYRTAVEGMSGREVADELQIPVATVYSSRFHVQKLVSEEIAALEKAQGIDPTEPAT